MNIINKLETNIHATGKDRCQLSITFRKETVKHAKLVHGEKVNVSVLENGSILIEKAVK